ncbi:MAG: hypothetical protein WA584_10915 [Pyrinomonadaceae bacterium]
MRTVSELEQEIRDLINSPRKRTNLLKDKADWSKLCSSLDVIGDTEQAFDSYINIQEPNSFGEKYLILYGVLQALFIQQDAITHLSEALGLTYTVDPLLTQIREIRNDSSGHPTKRGGGKGKKFNHISRISMKRHNFKLMTAFPDGSHQFTDVDVKNLIESQRNTVKTALIEISDKLKEEEMRHREEFRDIKLADNLSNALNYYHYEKISEAISDRHYGVLGLPAIEILLKHIESFKSDLQERGVLDVYDDSVGHYSNLLNYSLNELKEFVENPSESKLNDTDANIYLFFIRKNMETLIEIAREIDEEYSAQV